MARDSMLSKPGCELTDRIFLGLAQTNLNDIITDRKNNKCILPFVYECTELDNNNNNSIIKLFQNAGTEKGQQGMIRPNGRDR